MGKKSRKRRRNRDGDGGGDGGAWAHVTGEVVGNVLGQLLADGTEYALDRFGSGRGAPPHQDLGFRILVVLHEPGGQPVALAELAVRAGAGLLEVVAAVQALRRVRLVKFADGRRSVVLTEVGRAALVILARDAEAPRQQPEMVQEPADERTDETSDTEGAATPD